jgi:hypothetical protein
MRVTDPLRPELDRHPWKHFLGEDASTDKRIGLQDQWSQTRTEHASSGDHPRQAGTDDDDVRFHARRL